MVDIKEIILSKINLITGTVSMPKGFEIDNNLLVENILKSKLTDSPFPFSKDWDKLNRFIVEHIIVEHNINLVNKNIFANYYKPETTSLPIQNCDPLDYRNSPDYTCLYGVSTESCFIKIYYDDNRRKNRSWDIELKKNCFIMFPTSQKYCVINKQKKQLNFILTTTYEFI